MKSIASFLSLAGFTRFSRPLQTPLDLQEAGLTPLGSIGWFKQATASTHPTAGYSHLWDAYRAVAVQVLKAAPSTRIVVITSASPEEGKSTTAANLATALARDGHRVVLIDANLRWPSLRNPNRDDTTFGLAELLINGSLEAQHALARTSERGLYLLPAGDAPSTTTGLLHSPRLRTVLDTLRRAMDYVIIDAPPILEGDDAAVLTQASDATIIVVEAGRTRRRTLKQALDTLMKVGVHVTGAVLNRADVSAGELGTPTKHASVVAHDLPMETALAEAFANPSRRGTEPARGGATIGEAVAPMTREPETPRLRLVQPYERPLLPFGEPELPGKVPNITATAGHANDPFTISIEELLVDLEETLSLIRRLRRKQASG